MAMQGGTPVTAATGATTLPTTAPSAFTVSGVAYSNDVIARVMERLGRVPLLGNVTLQSSTEAPIGNQDAFSFTMSADVIPPGADR